jgi:hypothetical protein
VAWCLPPIERTSLTTEFAAGRRISYLPPLRLYLTASFLFFLALPLFGTPHAWHVQIAPGIDAHGHVFSRTPMMVALAGAAGVALYGFQALRVAYGGRWWPTLARASGILMLYAIALVLLIQGLGIASILLA